MSNSKAPKVCPFAKSKSGKYAVYKDEKGNPTDISAPAVMRALARGKKSIEEVAKDFGLTVALIESSLWWLSEFWNKALIYEGEAEDLGVTFEELSDMRIRLHMADMWTEIKGGAPVNRKVGPPEKVSASK